MQIRLDRMLGRHIVSLNGQRIGRLEEFHVKRDGHTWTVVEYDIGAAGLWNRLGLGARLLIGLKPHGYRARWDQLQIVDEGPLRLTCPVAELQRL